METFELFLRYLNPLFELSEIKQLTKEDMEKYKKSVLDYRDVRDSIGLALEEGRKEERISFVQKCLQKNMPVEDIVDLTGFSKEQIILYTVNSKG